jgi:DNA-binding transcriptional MerR regulator
MNRSIPGTVLQLPDKDASYLEEQFRSMFLAGDIMLGQVSAITGLEPYTIQNWVKRGFLTPPVNKRYTLRQLCRIININMLKAALPMEDICGLLHYINGQLDNEQDDLIDDSRLYFLFVKLAMDYRQGTDLDDYLDRALSDYQEPVPGAKKRVKKVLRIMLTAWGAAQLRQRAEDMVRQLKTEN